MNYYLDTEFIEGMRKPIWWLPSVFGFNKPKWHIDLVSLAIESEDGRSYFAVSNEFNPRHASKWVKENVIKHLPRRYTYQFDTDEGGLFDNHTVEIKTANPVYKSLKEIADDVIRFCTHSPVFYAYYADYDWVVLCSLFGSMMGLPKGWPMYCRDLKQLLDEKAEGLLSTGVGTHSAGDKWYPETFEEALSYLKGHPRYPQQDTSALHDARYDAMFNRELHNFITRFQNYSVKRF